MPNLPAGKSNRTLYVDDELWEKIAALASDQHRSTNNLLVCLMHDYIEKQGPADGQTSEQKAVRA